MSRIEDNDKRKSSATAKTALGIGIGGLSLAALNGGLGGGGGMLSNLFGQNQYQQEKADRGASATTELCMLEKWIMPMMGQICTLQADAAVNRSVDIKNQEITGLLFKMAENNTDSKFAYADLKVSDAFKYTDLKVNDAFALSNAQTDYKIEKATCNVIKGTPYISPRQMADPYQAGTNILVSRHVEPVVADDRCGCPQNWLW